MRVNNCQYCGPCQGHRTDYPSDISCSEHAGRRLFLSRLLDLPGVPLHISRSNSPPFLSDSPQTFLTSFHLLYTPKSFLSPSSFPCIIHLSDHFHRFTSPLVLSALPLCNTQTSASAYWSWITLKMGDKKLLRNVGTSLLMYTA